MKETNRLIIYLVLTFALTWTYDFLVVKPIVAEQGYGTGLIPQLVVAAMMFFPALCVLLTRLFTKEGFKNSQLTLNFGKGRTRYYFIAWFLPAVLMSLGAVAYFLIFPGRFDSAHTYIIQQNAELGVTMTPEQMKTNILTGLFAAILLSPILNIVTCFGEEWGWRGYMMPKLLGKMKFLPAVLIGGFIWGLWHAPIIAMGHNYGTDYAGAPWTGIAMMCLFCIVLGTLLTYWSVKAGNCWPAIIGHGAVNGFAGSPLFFIAENNHTLLGPSAAGIIGGSALIVAAIVVIIIQTRQERKAVVIE
ncbi:MAG: CPBP family intramembrane metalloprotease [Bacteroidales bacterium]|nr:CPBP family intramembrane metalloprotease [Bacteroidales bacterium]